MEPSTTARRICMKNFSAKKAIIIAVIIVVVVAAAICMYTMSH